ncbi:hypothetical protein [Legionella spiritensis]|uniref:hypothetical protein n=1 Tax=Legionella spiritensis TaxID=452 RepID=UPI000F6FCF4F|nr:hypothetical protein [Legionella spiritensis]VEG92062.1 Uncharacterised protein [Legionella spiritensis]
MRFFQNKSLEQIRDYCQGQSLESLQKLKEQYGDSIEKNSVQLDENEHLINELNVRISALSLNEDEDRERKERERQNNLDNLPSDPTERYLMMQTLNFDAHYGFISIDSEKNELERQRQEILKNCRSIQQEIHSCVQELRIVLSVFAEKSKAEKELASEQRSAYSPG